LFRSKTTEVLATSALSQVEVVAALSKHVRMGQLQRQTFLELCNQFEHDFEQSFSGVAVSNAVIAVAGQILLTHSLRAYDAMQLASASELRRSLSAEFSGITFVSADAHLNEVALANDFLTENPNDHPSIDDAGTPPAR
jgi:uncharacterized protein